MFLSELVVLRARSNNVMQLLSSFKGNKSIFLNKNAFNSLLHVYPQLYIVLRCHSP